MTAAAGRTRNTSARIDLPSVTLVAASSVAIPATVRALNLCLEQVRFGAALLLTDAIAVGGAHPDLRVVPIAPIRSRADYSRFMLHALADHVATEHALCVQWDGYLLDARRWDEAFLTYDYIGAAWPQFDDDHDVGNGGFSLRSRRLLEATRGLPLDAGVPEDVAICRLHRPELERGAGIMFAPRSVARRFAFERERRRGDEFGFHGVFNLVQRLHSREALALIRSLDASLLARSERWELLWLAVRRGRMGLILEMASRLRKDRRLPPISSL